MSNPSALLSAAVFLVSSAGLPTELPRVGTSTAAQTQEGPQAFEPPAGPVAEAEEEDPFAQFQYEFIVDSTARWQFDNGDRSAFFNTTDGATPSCSSSEQCTGGAVCFEGQCRTRNQQFDPTGEDFGDLVTTFGGTVRWDEYVATARFDTALYYRPPEAASTASDFIRERLEQRYENQFQAEYLSLAYAARDIEITLGDYYVTLGRGLALGVRIADSVGVDNKLRGAEFKADLGPINFHTFGGFLNIKNYEPGTGFAFDDTNDFIGGGRVEVRFGKYLKFGGHGAFIQTPVIDDNQTELLNVGGTVELPRPTDWLSVYSEFVYMNRNRFIGTDRRLLDQDGIGLYVNANLYLGPVTLLAEGKIYDNLFNILPGDVTSPLAQRRQNINRLSEPPTAERFGATILTNTTVYGARGRLDFTVTQEVVPYISYGHYEDGGCGLFGFRGRGASVDAAQECSDQGGIGENVTGKAKINAVFGGVRARWSSGDISVEGGYRGEFFHDDQTPDPDKLRQEETHAQLDAHQRIASFTTELFFSGKELKQIGNAWLEGRAALTLGHRSGWSVTGAYEYTSISPNALEHYPSISGQWQVSPEVLVRALAGWERPGLKCSGGACRFFPGFEGIRLETSLRF